ncbi:MAG: DUF3365 domain-containing protein [Bernardetiaceae bacterium]
MRILPTCLYAALLASLLIACTTRPNTENLPSSDQELLMSQGLTLIQGQCITCHSPTAGHDDRIAPPLIAVKRHYLEDSPGLETFTQDLIAFVQQPDSSRSKMPGALRRFGLMPKMDFSEEQLTAIAYYLYHADLEAPDWFAEHERQAHPERKPYQEQGQEWAMATKAVLGKNLMQAIQREGPEGAVTFCNTRAYPLTDSMARVLGAHIKRVSDLPRNPQNTADERELAYITQTKAILAAGDKPKPQMIELNGRMVGYYPILTNAMCLQCHGQPNTDINSATLQKIDQKYPNDKARGYAADQLRGIWVVSMQTLPEEGK